MIGVNVASPVAIETAPVSATPEPIVSQPVAPTEAPNYTFNQVTAPVEDKEEEISDPFERR